MSLSNEQARQMMSAGATVNALKNSTPWVTNSASNGTSVGVVGSQLGMFANTNRMLIEVDKVHNGHIVRVARGEGYLSKTWICADPDKLMGIIAAAVADLTLETQSK